MRQLLARRALRSGISLVSLAVLVVGCASHSLVPKEQAGAIRDRDRAFTILTLAAGLMLTLEFKVYSEIIMTRVTVPVGEDIGFLPGTEEEKMTPWMGALEDNLDLAIARYNLPIANTDILRTKAGGFFRGVNTGVVQGTPGGGVGGFGTGAPGAGAGWSPADAEKTATDDR